MEGLEAALAKISSKNNVVAWRDDKTHGLIFPPENVLRRIQRYATAKGLDLQIIPSIYD